MSMTPQEFIKKMGAGWNLGNYLECHSISSANNKYRYWAYNDYSYTVKNGDTTITASKAVTLFKNAAVQAISMAFTCPENGLVDITLTNTRFNKSVQGMKFTITSSTVDTKAALTLIDTLEFPAFSEYKSTISLDCSNLYDESVVGKAIVLKLSLVVDELTQFPSESDAELSAIRKHLVTRFMSDWGSPVIGEPVVKAVADAGFKSVRIPVTWKGHYDELDDNGHIHIDTEFLDYIAGLANMFHDYGLYVLINMHHDDQDWLKTGTYLTDVTNVNRYKDIWTQIATYFKDYDEWLSFASNNETRNNGGAWEGGGVTETDIYGLMQIQKDFYDVVRGIEGNNQTRICLYPTYAAKTQYLNGNYTNPNDTNDKGKWNLPYNDPYGIAEIHPYSGDIATIQKYNKSARSKGIPVIYGEFGTSKDVYLDKNQCLAHTYTVAYATYYGMGTYIWDDGGGMMILNRKSCTMTNTKSKSLWSGYINNFIPSLVKCANLRKVDILLNNRRQDCYVGDQVTICLDTKDSVIISNEGSGSVALSGSTFTAGKQDIPNLLAISYSGEYNTIDVTVNAPEHWNETIYDDITKWQRQYYSPWDDYRILYDASYLSYPLVYIRSRCAEVEWHNSANNGRTLCIAEYDKSKKLIKRDSQLVKLKNGEKYILSPNCYYIGVYRYAKDENMKEGTYFVVRERDMDALEENQKTHALVANISDYKKYNISIYRTIQAAGGMDYHINMGLDCDLHIMEYNNDKLEEDNWYKNGDKFTTNLFTNNMRIEIIVPNSKIEDLVNVFNDKTFVPKLEYDDFITESSIYGETCQPITLGNGQTSPVLKNKFCSLDNKLLTYNGHFITR